MLHEYRVVESRHFGMVIELQAKNIPKAFHMFTRMTSHAIEMTTQKHDCIFFCLLRARLRLHLTKMPLMTLAWRAAAVPST